MPTCYCEYCGQTAGDVCALTASTCFRHPSSPHKGRHRLYEGGNASPATCRHCGQRASDIRALTAATCPRHPDGRLAGRHAPALRA